VNFYSLHSFKNSNPSKR